MGYTFLLFNISSSELVLIVIAVFLIFGPDKLPKIMRKAGKFTQEVKKALSKIGDEIQKETDEVKDEVEKPKKMIEKETKKIKKELDFINDIPNSNKKEM